VRATLRRFHNRSDATVVPTRALRRELEATGFRNVEVMARGVDIRLFNPSRRDARLRDQWGVDGETLAVIYVGRLAAEKNLALAVEAFRALQAQRPKARFVLVGDGPQAGELRRLNPDFVFCGMRTGEDLAAHYASADLFLFPSTSETYGNVVIEGMASGLAVLAYDYAAGEEHIVDAENGALAPFDDDAAFVARARELSTDLEGLRRLGLQARLTAEGLDWRRIHERFETILSLDTGTEVSDATAPSYE
jgi:glycosyltransferase involved in cell wall biosynthesis